MLDDAGPVAGLLVRELEGLRFGELLQQRRLLVGVATVRRAGRRVQRLERLL